MIKSLTRQEVSEVSGGFTPPPINPLMGARLALYSFPGLGMVAGAAKAGWAAGQWLNENTDIQAHLAGIIDNIASPDEGLNTDSINTHSGHNWTMMNSSGSIFSSGGRGGNKGIVTIEPA